MPTPGGSNVPRANTTSTSAHGAADADGMPIAGLSSAEVVKTAAPNKRLIILISIPPPYLVPDPGAGRQCPLRRRRHLLPGSAAAQTMGSPHVTDTTSTGA